MNNRMTILNGGLLFALLVTTVIGLPQSTGAQTGSPEVRGSKSPFACNRMARLLSRGNVTLTNSALSCGLSEKLFGNFQMDMNSNSRLTLQRYNSS